MSAAGGTFSRAMKIDSLRQNLFGVLRIFLRCGVIDGEPCSLDRPQSKDTTPVALVGGRWLIFQRGNSGVERV